VVEYVDGGELFDAIVARGGLAEMDCARIVHQVLEALEYMHSQVRCLLLTIVVGGGGGVVVVDTLL
jgi:serine/threonine protein kinase